MSRGQKRQSDYWQTGTIEQKLFEQLRSAVEFATNRFNLNMQLHDAVKLDEVPARQMFAETSKGTFILLGTSLPKHDNVKSVFVNEDFLYLETNDAGVRAIQQPTNRGFLGRTRLQDSSLKLDGRPILVIIAPANGRTDVFRLCIPWATLDMAKMITALRAASLCTAKAHAQRATTPQTAQKVSM